MDNYRDLQDFIEQVKRANDIVDVIGSHLELRRSGTTYFARCPFHGEKTASFSVNHNGQFYHCFGCGESGDVIKFIQKYESCSFMEALEMLAKRTNLKMPELPSQKADVNFAEKKKKKDLHMEICKQAAVFYYKSYYSPAGEIARNYMKKRGFSDETCKKFGIGYSPDATSLVNVLRNKFPLQECIACGVLQNTRNGVADSLAGRLIVPIFNISGKVIAFGGRGLDEKTISYGKYKNTSETSLFVKKDNLFALNIAKEQKQQANLPNIVIVEGYMDVIAMYQAGFRRVVASMGTSLTENQAKLLSRLTDTVYICYDGDAAGQKATIRGMDILDSAGLEVKVVSVPENLDPDEYINKYGAQAFEENVIAAAKSLPDYKLDLLEKAFPIHSTDPATRNNALPKYVMGAVTMLKQLDDVRREQYIAAVSLVTGYSQEYFRRKMEGKQTEEAPLPDALTTETQAKYFIAASILAGQDYANLAEKPVCDSRFLSDLFQYIANCAEKGEKPHMDMMYTVCPDAAKEEYDRILNVDFSQDKYESNREYFEQCLKIVHVEKLKVQREQLLQQIKAHPEDTELLAKISEINRLIG